MNDQQVLVDWKEVDNYLNSAIRQFDVCCVSGVYGIPRGGSVLATMLSHKANIPLLAAPYRNCIIIDDIADTGKTLLHYSEKRDCYITTMFYHKQSLVIPDYWYKEKTNKWIVYPWEG